MEITTIFLALLSLMYVVHMYRVSQRQGHAGTSVGEGDDRELLRRIRIQRDFAEYVPLLLFIMWMVEYNIGDKLLVWVFGVIMLAGRVLHAFGMWSEDSPMWARTGGMVCTIAPLALGALYILFLALT